MLLNVVNIVHRLNQFRSLFVLFSCANERLDVFGKVGADLPPLLVN